MRYDPEAESSYGVEAWETTSAAPWNQPVAIEVTWCHHGTPLDESCGGCQAEAEVQAEAETQAHNPYTASVQELIFQATRSHEYWYLAGADLGPDPYQQLEAALQAGLDEVKMLREHAHQWDENDYCNICGADGRA